jgi:hypothetical protein
MKVVRENKTENRVRYTITFDPKPAPLPSILVKNWKVMLDLDQRLKHLFPAPPMTCLKRGPNLADELIRAKVPRPPKQCATRAAVTGFRSCKGGRRKCSLCPFSGAASDGKTIIQEVKIHHSGEIIQIKEIITCKDSFCKYILTSTKPGCMKQYGGLFTRQVYERFAEHLASIMDPNTTCPVGLHWQEPGHKVQHLEFIPIEKLGGPRDPAILRQRETDLINRLDLIRKGLNRQL